MATAKSKAKAKAPAAASAALPSGSNMPEGFKQIGGGYADTWNPEPGDSITGETTSPVKTVEMTQGRKKVDRRCVEITDSNTGERHTLWESAALGEFFDTLVELGEGTVVWIRFDGLGKSKKAGQNPPKLFSTGYAA